MGGFRDILGNEEIKKHFQEGIRAKRISHSYIIHGEIEIIMLNDAFEEQWTFAGRDIFATQSNKNPFTICDNTIELFDWEDNYYKIDFDGNLVEEKPTK